MCIFHSKSEFEQAVFYCYKLHDMITWQLNSHQPAHLYLSLWQAGSVMSVPVGSTKTQEAPRRAVHHAPATTTLTWPTQSPVTESPGNASSVCTTPMEHTASSANPGILAQPLLRTAKVSEQQHCNCMLSLRKDWNKLGYREKLALRGMIKLKQANGAVYESPE